MIGLALIVTALLFLLAVCLPVPDNFYGGFKRIGYFILAIALSLPLWMCTAVLK